MAELKERMLVVELKEIAAPKSPLPNSGPSGMSAVVEALKVGEVVQEAMMD